MSPTPVPLPLKVAAIVAGLEGTLLVVQGLALLFDLSEGRVTMGLTSTFFFVVYGGFLVFCAVRLLQRGSWARAPVVLAQLVQIPVGLSFWGGETTWVAVVLVLSAAAVLAGIFHPASLAALAEPDPEAD